MAKCRCRLCDSGCDVVDIGIAGPRSEYRPRMSQSFTQVDASEAVNRRCWRPSGRNDSAVTEMSLRRLMLSVLLAVEVLVSEIAVPLLATRLLSACAEASVRMTLAYGASEPQAE